MESIASRALFLPCYPTSACACKLKSTKNVTPSSPSSHFPATLKLLSGNAGKPSRLSALSCSSGPIEGSKPFQDLAILIEVEGVLADLYGFGNRRAFNIAFQKLGLDCASWTETIYADLLRKAGDDEERMLSLFFKRIGWPISVPTNEEESFMTSVLREKTKALEKFAASESLTLCPGVEKFIDDALLEGIPVILLTAYNKQGDSISRHIIGKLGEDRISKLKIVGKEEVEGSIYGRLVFGKEAPSSLDDQLDKAQKTDRIYMKTRRYIDEAASAPMLGVNIDTSPSESFVMIAGVVASLHAGAEYAKLPVNRCILIAGCRLGLLGAEQIGMPCIAFRKSLSGVELGAASANVDGFEGGDLTVPKLRSRTWA